MEYEKILNQFTVIEKKMSNAKLNFVSKIEDKQMIDESLFHLIKAHDLLDKMIREISPDRFATRVQNTLVTPALSIDKLFVCNICGSSSCQSDHN